jgi:hypothetical protein
MARKKVEQRQEWARKNRTMAEGRLSGEQVEAVAAFRRQVWWDAGDDFFAIFAAPHDAWQVARGHRLPRRFMVVVTREAVHISSALGAGRIWLWGMRSPRLPATNVRFLLETKDRLLPNHVTLRVNRGGELEYMDLESFGLEREPGAAEVVAALKQ